MKIQFKNREIVVQCTQLKKDQSRQRAHPENAPQCHICGRICSTTWNLKQHIEKHYDIHPQKGVLKKKFDDGQRQSLKKLQFFKKKIHNSKVDNFFPMYIEFLEKSGKSKKVLENSCRWFSKICRKFLGVLDKYSKLYVFPTLAKERGRNRILSFPALVTRRILYKLKIKSRKIFPTSENFAIH